MRVLVVEDNNEIRSLYEDILNDRGYEVYAFSRARDAIAWIVSDQVGPDIILTDYKMPGMDGVEFLQNVNELKVSCPTVMVSSSIDPEIHARAEQLGAEFYDKLDFRKVLNLIRCLDGSE
jgi:DNA-binding NtrC family response regulator